MKAIIILLASLIFFACTKEHCKRVVITSQGSPCGIWAIRVGDKIYPADSIPQAFQVEAIPACAEYELYQDLRMCACCGGTWARIISIRHLPD